MRLEIGTSNRLTYLKYELYKLYFVWGGFGVGRVMWMGSGGGVVVVLRDGWKGWGWR